MSLTIKRVRELLDYNADNRTGVVGVFLNERKKESKRFEAYIAVGNRLKFLGGHPTMEAAVAARRAAEAQYRGQL